MTAAKEPLHNAKDTEAKMQYEKLQQESERSQMKIKSSE